LKITVYMQVIVLIYILPIVLYFILTDLTHKVGLLRVAASVLTDRKHEYRLPFKRIKKKKSLLCSPRLHLFYKLLVIVCEILQLKILYISILLKFKM